MDRVRETDQGVHHEGTQSRAFVVKMLGFCPKRFMVRGGGIPRHDR
jgi:hypothetical protein